MVPFFWTGEYVMDGRAIRDEWADVNSTGTQTRIYDPETDSWKIRWVGIGTLEGFGLARTQGDFSATAQPDGTIEAPFAEFEYEGDLYRSVITFFDISARGFEWSLQTYKDGVPVGRQNTISCLRTAG